MPKFCAVPTSTRRLANQKNAIVSRDTNGRFKVISQNNRGFFQLFDTEAEARTYLSELGREVVPELDASLPTAHRGVQAGASTPHQPQAQLTFREKIADFDVTVRKGVQSFQKGIGAVVTPIEKFAQAAENAGDGFAFSKVYNTTQVAKNTVKSLLTTITRPKLNGQSYEQALRAMEGKVAALPDGQSDLVTLLSEAFTKPEIAAKFGLDQQSINMANIITKSGQADNMGMFVRINGVMNNFLKNRPGALSEISALRNQILDGKLPESATSFLDGLERSVGLEQTWDDLFESLQLTAEEAIGLKQVKLMLDNPEAFNIPAIFRYATAENLEAGWKNGRSQFIAKRKMTKEAVELSDERTKILDLAFGDAGLDRELILGYQMPVFRQFVDSGVFPSKTKASVLDSFVEGKEVLTRRVLSGHLDPAQLNPHVSAYKHVNNLLMREHFDDVSRLARNEIDLIEKAEKKFTARVMSDYLHDVEGGSSIQFDRLTESIRSSGRGMGIQIDDRLAERVVGTLGKLAYQASIPFRAALVVRNYFQTLLFTAPIVGRKAWVHGLQAVNPVKREEQLIAFNVARRAGAIDPNTNPLFAADEIFGIKAARFGDKLGPGARKLSFQADKLFDIGFSVYRSADDWGRAVAFFAGRKRVIDAQDLFVKNADMEGFKVAAKVKTFDETIEVEFERIVRSQGTQAAADFIGKKLADKTHLLYGNANRPAGWGGISGRLFGQFGTFPTQYAGYVVENLTRGTVKDRAEWAAAHGAINAGIIIGGAEAFGADLTSWATIPSIRYTGGPYTEVAASLYQAWGGSDAERSMAIRNLKMMFPSMDHPSSIFIPGSYFVGDIQDAFGETSLSKILGEGAGVRFLKAGEQNSVAKMFEFMR